MDVSTIELDGIDQTLRGYRVEDHSSAPLETQLAVRERDLMVAARVGQALLEHNDALRARSDCMEAEYVQLVERLAQERHELRSKLTSVSSAYESRLAELQADIHAVRSAQMEHDGAMADRLRQAETKTLMREDQMTGELVRLRTEFEQRRTTLDGHVHHLETLKSQIRGLLDAKSTLEEQLHSVLTEKQTLASDLSATKRQRSAVELAEKQQSEQLLEAEKRLRDVAIENERLRAMLDDQQQRQGDARHGDASGSQTRPESLGDLVNQDSLYAELHGAGAVGVIGHVPVDFSSFTSPVHDSDSDDVSVDGLEPDRTEPSGATPSPKDQPYADMQFYARLCNADDADTWQLKQAILSIYQSLRLAAHSAALSPVDQARLTAALGPALHEDASQALLDAQDCAPGQLKAALGELRGLMEDVVTRELEMAKLTKSSAAPAPTPQDSRLDSVKSQLASCRERLEAMGKQLDEHDESVRQSGQTFGELSKKLASQRRHIGSIISKDEKAKSKTPPAQSNEAAEEQKEESPTPPPASAAKPPRQRIDMTSLNTELMDVIQQKIQLSQQLELWQSQYDL